jgi:hypothetical protein
MKGRIFMDGKAEMMLPSMKGMIFMDGKAEMM